MRLLLVAALMATTLSGCLTDEPTDDLATTPPPAAVETVHDKVSFTDTVNIIAGTESLDGCGTQGTVDVAETTWTVAAPADANESHAIDMVVTISWLPSIVDADVVVYGPDGTELARGTEHSAGVFEETLDVGGKHPTGDFRIVVLGCVGGGDVDVAATAMLGYVPA